MEYERIITDDDMEIIMLFMSMIVKRESLADIVYDGGGEVFRNISLGQCYHAISKMIIANQIEAIQGQEIMEGIELYGFNGETPIPAEIGRYYYKNYISTKEIK